MGATTHKGAARLPPAHVESENKETGCGLHSTVAIFHSDVIQNYIFIDSIEFVLTSEGV